MQGSGIYPAIAVAALGYFVDVYDLVLFSVVRVASLAALGLSPEEQFTVGIDLLNAQMIGMLVGGVFFGVLGDKKGRLSVLFGSILLYSAANIANAFVTSVPQYLGLRFLAGIGLAGELGAGITLVAELMPKERRGLGTTIVATVGVCGAIAAATIGQWYSWRVSYFIGGTLGLLLLALRIKVQESGMFKGLSSEGAERGSLRLLLGSHDRRRRYAYCILSGLPIWFVIGVLVTFAPEIGKAAGFTNSLTAAQAIQYAYIGLILGDLASGLISQKLQSRKLVLIGFLIFNCITTIIYLSPMINDAQAQLLWCIPLGFSAGYWAMLVTSAAEQFGTNLRATAATSVPNFIRGAVPLLTYGVEVLKAPLGTNTSMIVVGLTTSGLAIFAACKLKESFHQDLDWIETR